MLEPGLAFTPSSITRTRYGISGGEALCPCVLAPSACCAQSPSQPHCLSWWAGRALCALPAGLSASGPEHVVLVAAFKCLSNASASAWGPLLGAAWPCQLRTGLPSQKPPLLTQSSLVQGNDLMFCFVFNVLEALNSCRLFGFRGIDNFCLGVLS